ncbi:MAG: hypothetical protein ACKVXR_18205 [Planctomycetota bacterium]
MRRQALGSAWMPPLLVGAAAGIAAEVAVAILLYAGPGFMRSLTTVLAVEGAALALGLHAAPVSSAHPVESLRRRWLFCLASFIAAALYGTAWSLFEGLGEGRIGQGLGLALLAGLPMFACGSVLGSMGSASSIAAAGPRGSSAPAALGAALGFVATGTLLPLAPIPASLLVGCLVLLSGGAMVYGAVLATGESARAPDVSSRVETSEYQPPGEAAPEVAIVGSASVAETGGDAPAQ